MIELAAGMGYPLFFFGWGLGAYLSRLFIFQASTFK